MGKLKVTKKGNKTITRNTLGSNDKTLSILTNTSEALPINITFDEFKDKVGYQPTSLDVVIGYEKHILSWLKDKKLPTKDKKEIDHKNKVSQNQTLSNLLTNDHDHITGVIQASNCIRTIQVIKDYISNDNFESACYESLHLVRRYSFFIYAINEGSINSGNNAKKSLGKKSLSSECIQECKKEVIRIKAERKKCTNVSLSDKQIRNKICDFIYHNYNGKKIKEGTLRLNYPQILI